jgi:hypothetical protein
MAIEYTEQTLIPVRRDGQISSCYIGGSGGGSSLGGGTSVYIGGNGINVVGTTININTGTTITGSTITGDIYVVGNTRNTGDVLAFSASDPPIINWWDSMPWATCSCVGGIIVGQGLQITNGVLSSSGATGGVTCYCDLCGIPSTFAPTCHNNSSHSAVYITSADTVNNALAICGCTPACFLGATSTACCAATAGNALAICGCVPSCFLGATSTACCAATAGNSLALCGCTPACFLGATACASDSAKLENHAASYFATALTNPVVGTGTANYLPKFTGTTALGNSNIFDNGTCVGIGTITPQKELEISKSGGATVRITNSYDTAVQDTYIGGIEFWNNDADTPKVSSFIKSYAAETFGRRGYMTLGVSKVINETATEVMRITDLGNVGIGTTSPTEKLDVCGDIVSSGDIIAYH